MAGIANRSVTARPFCFLVEGFGARKMLFLGRRVALEEDSAELFWVDVWLECRKAVAATVNLRRYHLPYTSQVKSQQLVKCCSRP